MQLQDGSGIKFWVGGSDTFGSEWHPTLSMCAGLTFVRRCAPELE